MACGCQHLKTSTEVMEGVASCRDLPPEVLALVFQRLDDDDLASASGVHSTWYWSALWELSKRGVTLYRWPFDQPSCLSGHLALAGEKSLLAHEQTLKGIVHLSLYMDVPSQISPDVLSNLIQPGMRSLTLGNVILDVDSMRVILASELSGLLVKIKKRRHISKKANRILLDHRELLDGLVIDDGTTYRSVCLSSRDTDVRCREDIQNVGQIAHPPPERTDRLHIYDGSHLTRHDWYRISRLDLVAFSVYECNVNRQTVKDCFTNGFKPLKYLTIWDCPNLSIECVETICKKQNLIKLRLDLKRVGAFDLCLQALCGSPSLKNVTVRVSSNIDCEHLKKSLKINGRKSIVLINEYLQSDDNFSLFNLENGSKFRYVNPRTTNHVSYPETRCDCYPYWRK